MVRVIVDQAYIEGKSYKEISCLSTDTKPTGGMVTGSLALEVDTGNVYAYDETSDGTWNKIAELGGGT